MVDIDIVISVVLGFVTVVMAFIGLWITLYPPTEKQKRKYKTAFVLLSLASIGLIIWQGIRNSQKELQNSQTQSDLREELKKLRSDHHEESIRREQAERRREQAERDLAAIVKKSGESIRAGIASDIKKLPSEPAKIAGIRCIQRAMTSDRENAPFALVVTVQPDGVISPLAMEIAFDGPVLDSTYSVIGSGTILGGGRVPATKQENNIVFRINSPPVSPEAPVIVRVYSQQRIRLTKCNYIPF